MGGSISKSQANPPFVGSMGPRSRSNGSLQWNCDREATPTPELLAWPHRRNASMYAHRALVAPPHSIAGHAPDCYAPIEIGDPRVVFPYDDALEAVDLCSGCAADALAVHAMHAAKNNTLLQMNELATVSDPVRLGSRTTQWDPLLMFTRRMGACVL